MPPNEPTPTNEKELDRQQLRELTQLASEPGKYFGRDVILTQELREQLLLATTQARKVLQPFVDSSHTQWQEYLRLSQEGSDKGILTSFTTHEGTSVPTWCIDGGELARVEKTIVDGSPKVKVPTHIFNLINWFNITESIENIAKLSDDIIKGRSTLQLGRALTQLSYLLEPEQQRE